MNEPLAAPEPDGVPRGRVLMLAIGGGERAPVRARCALRVLIGDLDPKQLALLELLITELVTNSVVHGGAGPLDEIGLHVAVGEDHVRVDVVDSGPGFTQAGAPRPRDIGGLGLVLIERTARRWGIADGGRRVWLELDRPGGGRVAG